MNWDPPAPPVEPTEPFRKKSYRTFWIAGATVLGALVILPTINALSGDDVPATAPSTTALSGDDVPATAPSTTALSGHDVPATSPSTAARASPRGNSGEVPALQASGCSAVDGTVAADVNARLAPGLTLGLAASSSLDGVTWLLGSIYRESDGERISSADTWAAVGGRTYAVSGSAREFSNLPNGLEVVPEAFSNSTRSDLETCVTNAIINQ